jgi:hypothetical protein
MHFFSSASECHGAIAGSDLLLSDALVNPRVYLLLLPWYFTVRLHGRLPHVLLVQLVARGKPTESREPWWR